MKVRLNSDRRLDLQPSISAVSDLALSEAGRFAGVVTEEFADKQRFYCRFLLPASDSVCSGDIVRAGIAVNVEGDRFVAYPYIHRRVCRNGAIRVQDAPGFSAMRLGVGARDDEIVSVSEEMRQAIRNAAHPDMFVEFRKRFQSAAQTRADRFLNMLPRLSRQRARRRKVTERAILSEFERVGDESLYGLINAITATARDTRDQRVKWQLECLAGDMAYLVRLPRNLMATKKPCADLNPEVCAVA